MLNKILKLEIFWSHEVLKLLFKCSKNSSSWNIGPPKIPIFQWGIKNFGPNFSYLIFEAVNFLDFRGPAEMRGNDFEEK